MTLTATVYRFPGDEFVTDLPLATEITWQEQISEPGSGSLNLPIGDPALALIERQDLIVITLGETEVFGFTVDKIFEHTLDEDGTTPEGFGPQGAAEYAQLSGLGSGGISKWGVVAPANGIDAEPVEQDRLFSWQSIQYVEGNDGQAWDEVADAGAATGAERVPGVPQVGYPAGAPDVGARWIWGDPGDDTDAPPGQIYGRATLTLGGTTDLLIVFATDNTLQGLWFDGQLLATLPLNGGSYSQNYLQSHTVSVRASAGDHQLAFLATNHGGPGGFFAVVGTIDGAGEFGSALLTSNTSDWNVLAYPATPPGMTPGQAVLIALGEIQDRGGLTWLNVDFDEDMDSNGTAWPVVGDISTKTGTDLLTFLQELSVAYIDWRVSPDGQVLSLYVRDDLRTIDGPAVALEPAPVNDPNTGNLLQLDRTRT